VGEDRAEAPTESPTTDEEKCRLKRLEEKRITASTKKRKDTKASEEISTVQRGAGTKGEREKTEHETRQQLVDRCRKTVFLCPVRGSSHSNRAIRMTERKGNHEGKRKN